MKILVKIISALTILVAAANAEYVSVEDIDLNQVQYALVEKGTKCEKWNSFLNHIQYPDTKQGKRDFFNDADKYLNPKFSVQEIDGDVMIAMYYDNTTMLYFNSKRFCESGLKYR